MMCPDDFFTAYITAALWSSYDNSDPETGGEPLDKNYSADDLAPEALTQMRADCNRFYTENQRVMETARWDYETPAREAGAEPSGELWTIQNGDKSWRTATTLEELCETEGIEPHDRGNLDEQHGHDFWLTRNGHGAGFCARGYGPVGETLSEAARAFRETDLEVGDDGKIYLM